MLCFLTVIISGSFLAVYYMSDLVTWLQLRCIVHSYKGSLVWTAFYFFLWGLQLGNSSLKRLSWFSHREKENDFLDRKSSTTTTNPIHGTTHQYTVKYYVFTHLIWFILTQRINLSFIHSYHYKLHYKEIVSHKSVWCKTAEQITAIFKRRFCFADKTFNSIPWVESLMLHNWVPLHHNHDLWGGQDIMKDLDNYDSWWMLQDSIKNLNRGGCAVAWMGN